MWKRELSYLFGNADLVACVFDPAYAPALAAVAGPRLTTFVHIEDRGADTAALGSVGLDDVVAAGADRHGLPRALRRRPLHPLHRRHHRHAQGRVWRHEDIFFALGHGIDALTNERVTTEYTRAEQARVGGPDSCSGHPAAHARRRPVGTLSQWFIGNTIVLLRRFDAEAVWERSTDEG